MPLLRKAVLVPSKGVDWSQPATFIDERSGYPKNMRFDKYDLRKRPGKTLYGPTAISGGQIMGLGILELATLKYLLRVSKTKFQKYNTSTEDWDSIAATDFTGGDDDRFFFATVAESGLVLVTNGVDKIRKWTGSGNNAALGGNPPLAKYLCYLSPYVLVANIVDSPWKVQWPDTADPETWSGGNSGSKLLSDEPSAIQNIMKLNEFAAVYKKDSLWLGRKVETSDIFDFDCIKTGIGLASPKGVADAEGKHYFIGWNDFFVWNGIREESIGRAVRDEVFNSIQRDKIQRCFAVHVQELTEIWFFMVLSGQSWPTVIWKYNYRTGFWYYDTCDNITAALKWEKITSSTWQDMVGDWDSATLSWNATTQTAKWEEIVFGDNDGNTSFLDYSVVNDMGVAYEGLFGTKDFFGDRLEYKSRFLRLDCWVKGTNGGKLYVDYSTDRGSNWTNIPYTSSQAYIELTSVMTKRELYFDIVAEHIRFRFRNAESGEEFYLRNFYPYYLAREEIKSYRA